MCLVIASSTTENIQLGLGQVSRLVRHLVEAINQNYTSVTSREEGRTNEEMMEEDERGDKKEHKRGGE